MLAHGGDPHLSTVFLKDSVAVGATVLKIGPAISPVGIYLKYIIKGMIRSVHAVMFISVLYIIEKHSFFVMVVYLSKQCLHPAWSSNSQPW